MDQCPLAYVDPCSKCAQFGNCCPSQALQKLEILENEIQDLKRMLQQLVGERPPARDRSFSGSKEDAPLV